MQEMLEGEAVARSAGVKSEALFRMTIETLKVLESCGSIGPDVSLEREKSVCASFLHKPALVFQRESICPLRLVDWQCENHVEGGPSP